ncbi:DUF5067 domain-containing protein [Oceanobacillus timonensis]|uniref:DUF5067 domain-containing protein n=1 Tax=Oceanobacillus timonensis TaxID=1926285 RepID=UPI0009BA9915|nr:DUF5067 domain-containing protein [Oceanobacillus timonensis]
MIHKTSKIPHYFLALILFIALAVFMIGCSSNSEENNGDSNAEGQTESVSADDAEAEEEDADVESGASDLYHEIGETFEMIGYYSDVPAEVTVNDIWIEDDPEHQEYIEDNIASPTEDDVVVFVDYTVKNVGDTDMTMGDLIPEYTDANTELDLSYPENDTFTDFTESFQVPLEAGESMDVIGTVPADKKDQYTSALMWNITQDVPEIVFHTPQEERRDKIGTYDIGEDMYLFGQGEDSFYRVNISNIEVVEDYEGIERFDDDSSFFAIDMEFENQLEEDVSLYSTFPSAFANGQEAIYSDNLVIDGQVVEDLYEGPEGEISPGETIEGTVYLEVIDENMEDVKLLYLNPTLLTFPDYAMRINYNVED